MAVGQADTVFYDAGPRMMVSKRDIMINDIAWKNRFRPSLLPAITFCLGVFMVGCGGGGGSSGGPAPAQQNVVIEVPSGVNATENNAEVTLDWSTVEGVDGYNIYYSTNSDIDIDNPGAGSGQWVSDVTPPHVIAGLINNETYYFVVTATDGERESDASTKVAATPMAGISGRTIRTAQRLINPQDYQHSMSGFECADGQVVVGGGFQISDVEDQRAALRIHSSFPEYINPLGYRWNGHAFNAGSLEEESLKVKTQSICIDEPAGFDHIGFAGRPPLPAGDSGLFSLMCPRGRFALSGGVKVGSTDDGRNLQFVYSQWDADSIGRWNSILHNLGDSDAEGFTVNTFCTEPLRGLERKTRFTTRPNDWLTAGSFGELSVQCDAGKLAIHGGLWRPGEPEEQPADLILQQSYADPGDGRVWRVRAFNSTGEAVPMGAFAVCVASDD